MEAKVAFSMGEGTSMLHVCAVVSIPYVSLWALWPLQHLASSSAGVMVAECCAVVLPFCVACLCEGSTLVLMHFALAALVLHDLFQRRGGALMTSAADADDAKALAQLNQERLPALTHLRAIIMLQTVFCILAVDFPLFPRHAAKTLTHGHSVMDLGVGAVVLIGALTRRRHRSPSPGEAAERPLQRRSSQLVRVVSRHAPLVLVGLARVLAVRATAYHEVHSEYGTHWNFFFTLAGVALALEAMRPPTARAAFGMGACVLVAHQAALLGGLAEYVIHAPRVGLVSANKEGLVSLAGYLGLALVGSAMAEALTPCTSTRAWRARLGWLGALDGLLWAAAAAADSLVQPTSRRLCNLAYVLWVLAQVVFTLCLCLACNLKRPGLRSALLESINRHPLTVFLLANILTGLVNLTLPTLEAEPCTAVGILSAYTGIVCAAATALARRRESANSPN